MLQHVCEAPDDRTRFVRETIVDPHGQWALGRAHLGVLNPEPQLGHGNGVLALFHGDLHDERDLRGSIVRDGTPGAPGAAGLVAALYRQQGGDVVSRLSGAFCAVILDRVRREIRLITDPLASYPLYWTAGPAGLVFGSELRAVLRAEGVPRAIDPRAVADYLVFGCPFGNKTLAAGVELVPPGTTLTYCWETGHIVTRRHADVAGAFGTAAGSREGYFEELADRFGAAVDRTFAGEHRYGLSLSGGMDSRAILSTVNGRADSLTTYTLGVEGCADQVIAEQLSSLTGTRHLFFELSDRYLADFLPNLARMVSLTDGMYLSHGLTEVLALNFIDEAGIDVLLRGHGGELAKASLAWPFHTDARIHAMKNAGELVPYLLSRANYISPGLDLATLFAPAWAKQVDGAPRSSLEESIGHLPLTPADMCSYVYLMEHHRRFTVGSLELFRQRVEVRLPFVDYDFLRLLFKAPSQWRDPLDIHRALTARHNPGLLRVRNSNTGARADAGPLAEAVFDKVNTIFKRLNVRGYRHYHNFDAWMKKRLLESVQSVLLDRQALDRGIFQESAVRRVIDETRTGAADHGYLLQVMLIVELWQRENL
jgi:asparagine synthase (glutamine-hydrolysing)